MAENLGASSIPLAGSSPSEPVLIIFGVAWAAIGLYFLVFQREAFVNVWGPRIGTAAASGVHVAFALASIVFGAYFLICRL